jgi:thymidine phosphorylase
VVMSLGEQLLVLCGIARSRENARTKLEQVLSNGRAAERFQRMVARLGGPGDLIDQPEKYLPKANIVRAIFSHLPGTVHAIDTRALGLAVIALGGGRANHEAPIDHSVGLSALAARNSAIGRDVPLAILHARDEQTARAGEAMVRSAYRLGEPAPPQPPVLVRIE